MPARVSYWTGVWEPAREALSKQVSALRLHVAPRSTVVSFASGQRTAWTPKEHVVRLAGSRNLSLRALAMLLEPRGDVTHVFGAVNSWHLLRAIGRRPVVFTVALPGPPLDQQLYANVSMFVAESEPLASTLRDAGLPRDRIRVIYPGVDLSCFSPRPTLPQNPFRLLFASSPADPAEFAARGIPLLVDVARACADVQVVLLCRRWGSRNALDRTFATLALPPNVTVTWSDVADMANVYATSHATACLYQEHFGKSCPNSVVEGLACGRPAIVADTCGVAEIITRHAAGVAVSRTKEAVLGAIEMLRADYPGYARRARSMAEDLFDIDAFCRSYARLYEQLALHPSR